VLQLAARWPLAYPARRLHHVSDAGYDEDVCDDRVLDSGVFDEAVDQIG